MTNNCLGIIAFSKNNNRITFFGVSKSTDFMKVGKKLVEVTLNQLDKTSKITATILKSDKKDIINEKKTYESFWIC
jgi:hypothetical protein